MELGLAKAVHLFKVRGNESRLEILRILSRDAHTVGAIVHETDMSQPLAFQYLRTLRQAGLVASSQQGRAITYRLADRHVEHEGHTDYIHEGHRHHLDGGHYDEL